LFVGFKVLAAEPEAIREESAMVCDDGVENAHRERERERDEDAGLAQNH
jgi:hypothetical protein